MDDNGSQMPEPDDRPKLNPPSSPPAVLKDEDEPSLYCPRCDSRLQQFQCKLVCRKCGYYMSCADYY